MSSRQREASNAHLALLVCIDSVDYWVDIANGFPYLYPIPLDSNGSIEIKHQFVNTRLVYRPERSVYVVQHRFNSISTSQSATAGKWTDNYYFRVDQEHDNVDIASMYKKHYDKQANFGPFLKNVRFNLWTKTMGVLVRNTRAYVFSNQSHNIVDMDLWDSGQSSQFATLVQQCGFNVNSDIFNLVGEAWAVSQENDGVIKAVEGVTVTGGFFDNTADSYVGSVTVWRSIETGNVAI